MWALLTSQGCINAVSYAEMGSEIRAEDVTDSLQVWWSIYNCDPDIVIQRVVVAVALVQCTTCSNLSITV